MPHDQTLQSLHCRDLRVENTKLKWPTVTSTLPVTKWMFKYSVSKPPKVVSLPVLFVEKIWNHSGKVNLVSFWVFHFIHSCRELLLFSGKFRNIALMYYLFAISTNFIQTWQKHRQLFGQKFISNQWLIWNFQMRSLTMQNMSFYS